MGTVPGIEEYLAEFTSEQAWGEDGYVVDKGMIPLPDNQCAEIGAQVKSLSKMALNQARGGLCNGYFQGGAVLYNNGACTLPLSERIMAVTLSEFWTR